MQNNTNKALAHSWRAVMDDETHPLIMNLKTCPLPGFNISPIELNTGTDQHILKANGNRIEFDELSMEFFISEDWANYMQLYNWCMEYLNTDQFITKDFTIQMFDNTNNIIKEFLIEDCWPYTLSTIETNVIDDDSYLLCTVSFAYERWLPL